MQIAEGARSARPPCAFALDTRSDINSLATLVAWQGPDAERFVRGSAAMEESEPLAVISSKSYFDPLLNEGAPVALDQMVKSAYRSMASQ